MEFYAGFVTSDAESRVFTVQLVPPKPDRTFIKTTDYRTSYLGVVQVSGLNSSRSLKLVDLATTPDQLGMDDDPPHTGDRVITTFLIRVRQERPAAPERI